MRSLIAAIALLTPQLAHADCICLNRGEEIREGQTACIKTANGGQMALCEKNLNVTSWKFLGQECPVAAKRTTSSEYTTLALLPR